MIQMSSYKYRTSHYEHGMVSQLSYLYNMNLYTWEDGWSLYWNGLEEPGHQYGLNNPSSDTRWANSLWLSHAIWQHRSGSTLAQVMAWCLMAPSHSLIPCWLPICCIHLSAISQPIPKLPFGLTSLKIILLNLQPHLPGSNELNDTALIPGP